MTIDEYPPKNRCGAEGGCAIAKSLRVSLCESSYVLEMSLYQARDWWSTTCGNDEEYEARSVVIGSIEGAPSEQGTLRACKGHATAVPRVSYRTQLSQPESMRWCAGNIVTGSLQGILRIYRPRQQDFCIEDLLLEAQLQAPILQLELGSFTA